MTYASAARPVINTLLRYEQHGAAELHELSRCPHRNAHLTDKAVEKFILQDRRRHPAWGPKKLQDLLLRIIITYQIT